MGPAPNRYVLERVYRQGGEEYPRKLTRQADAPVKRRVVQRWAGTHYIAPVWELDRDTD